MSSARGVDAAAFLDKADGSYAYNPNEDFVVREGTKLLVLGEVDDILALRRGLLDSSIGLRAP